MRERKDNMISIIKSLVPIKYKYSRKNKELDKTFRNMSLEYLLKTLDYHPKYYDEYAPSPEFINNKNQFDINFQNSCHYIKVLSDINNLPLVINNRNCLKNGTFNPDYEYNPIKNKEEQKQIILEKERRKKERLQDRLERLKKWRQSDSNVDPGKYHPNYDFVRKKITNVYIREPMTKTNKNNEKEKSKSNNKEDNKTNENFNKDLKSKNNKIDSKNNLKNSSIELIKDDNNNKSNITFCNNINSNESHVNSDNVNYINNATKIIKNIRTKNERNIKFRNNSNIDKKNMNTLNFEE